jgi:ABC-type Fe3+/spermidine/putrescine transport system ATPase subunit
VRCGGCADGWTRAIARFFGECNLLAKGSAGTIVVRPTSMHLGSANGASATAVTIPAVVEDVVFLGATMRVSCSADGLGRLLADAPVRAVAGLAPGDAVTLWHDPAEATPFPG